MSGKGLTDVRFAKARDVMRKEFSCIDGSATVAEAVKQMRETKAACLIVNRRTPDDAWAIVTQKDIVTKVVDPGKHVTEVHVYEIMTKPLVTVAPGLALKYCARLFRMLRIRRAPVFDGKQIIGMLSFSDIFDAIDDESHLIARLMEQPDEVEALLPVVSDSAGATDDAIDSEIDGFAPEAN